MLKIICKDILTVDQGIICHQVNCKGVMGSGIALAIKNKWPDVYNQYRRKFLEGGWNVGEIQIVEVGPNLNVCNIAGQNNYGRGLQTNYEAIKTAFFTLSLINKQKETPLPIYIPFLMGCGLAGGNWETYSKIIEEYIPDAIVCMLK
jgi:O-acetyl-ADP-ribose deacetylase (regulator of RNase III)